MGAGLACGVGFLGYATLFTLVLCGFLIVLGKVNFGAKKSPYKVLKVTVRDDFDYKREFEEVFNKYALSYELKGFRARMKRAFTCLSILFLFITMSMKKNLLMRFGIATAI